MLFNQVTKRNKSKNIGRTPVFNVGINEAMLKKMQVRKCNIYRRGRTLILVLTQWVRLIKDQLSLRTKLMSLL
jgi:hypothetical protein